mmetsp:Transcript_42146/g.57521  ORF Transcript_42146/g.57521 Transcript_42146/m.57521 type:complete len:221 (+) Transcript_42146:459-1121(+)
MLSFLYNVCGVWWWGGDSCCSKGCAADGSRGPVERGGVLNMSIELLGLVKVVGGGRGAAFVAMDKPPNSLLKVVVGCCCCCDTDGRVDPVPVLLLQFPHKSCVLSVVAPVNCDTDGTVEEPPGMLSFPHKSCVPSVMAPISAPANSPKSPSGGCCSSSCGSGLAVVSPPFPCNASVELGAAAVVKSPKSSNPDASQDVAVFSCTNSGGGGCVIVEDGTAV